MEIKVVRAGYAQGYCKKSANKGMFVVSDTQLRKMQNEKVPEENVREGSHRSK